MKKFNECKCAVAVCSAVDWKRNVLVHTGAHTLPALKHCSSVCSCEEMLVCLPPFLPSICFLLGALEEAAGLPCKMPTLPPRTMLLVPLSAQHTGRALMCHLMDAGLFRTTGSGSSGRVWRERHTEAN